MAGLSGAAACVPAFQFLYDLEMSDTVPLVSFIAMVSTVFRFILQFKMRHPKNLERNIIDYDIISISMPFVFLGSFFGIILGKVIGDVWQNILLEFTLIWAIFTSYKKAVEL